MYWQSTNLKSFDQAVVEIEEKLRLDDFGGKFLIHVFEKNLLPSNFCIVKTTLYFGNSYHFILNMFWINEFMKKSWIAFWRIYSAREFCLYLYLYNIYIYYVILAIRLESIIYYIPTYSIVFPQKAFQSLSV